MAKGIKFILVISILVSVADINADPIDESRKWGNVTTMIKDR